MITTKAIPDYRKVSAIPIKISFIGAPAVGKTTIINLLQGKSVKDGRYLPTQGFDLGRVTVENHPIRLFDFGGQKAYIKQYLEQYIIGSEIVFVVTDSTPQNVVTTNELIQYVQSLIGEDSQIIVIANKQDLPGHMDVDRIQSILQAQTYPFIAIRANNKAKLISIIETEIDIANARKMFEQEAALK